MTPPTGFDFYFLALNGKIKGFHPGFKRVRKATASTLSIFDNGYTPKAIDHVSNNWNDREFASFADGGDYLVMVKEGTNIKDWDFHDWNGRLLRRA